jgi:pimeloyl-ACP methyl ester carboxylesterase
MTDDAINARAREIAEREAATLVERTPGSARLYERASLVMPYGVASSFQANDPYPIYVRRGQGSNVWDVDENEYVDFHGGFGTMVVGHAHPKVVEAIERAARTGTHFAATTETAVALAEELCRRFRLDQVRFTNSGTEATMEAIRLAAHHADKFGAFVAINGFRTDPQGDGPAALASKNFHHPRISEAYFTAILHGGMSPHAPERARREAEWIAASSGLGVFKGDREYVTSTPDLREEARMIDAHRTPLWIVAGEYDPSMLGRHPAAETIAEAMPGAELRILPRLGPFMMTEDPARFRQAIVPILDEVSGRIGMPA